MRFFVLILALILCFSCRQTESEIPVEETVVSDDVETNADVPSLPKLIKLNRDAKEAVASWGPFNGVFSKMSTLNEVYAKETLELKLEELETACKDMESAPFPELFDQASVRSRAKVFRTFIQKSRADLYYRNDFYPSLRQVIRAYNAFLKQINLIVQQETPDDIPFFE
jgi:hypothetical protein